MANRYCKRFYIYKMNSMHVKFSRSLSLIVIYFFVNLFKNNVI